MTASGDIRRGLDRERASHIVLHVPDQPRYQARYHEGYWRVIDTQAGEVVPPPNGHYKAHLDGYLWDHSAAIMANFYNENGRR